MAAFYRSYNQIDTETENLSKIQEYIDIGISTTLNVAVDIEESNEGDEADEDIEKLKDMTLDYVRMEKELKQWLKAAELTKTAFWQQNAEANENPTVPNIEEIFKGKLSEVKVTSDDEDLSRHPKVQEFDLQVWNVHHSGQPLPSANEPEDMDQDVIIAQAPEESIICPLTKKQMVEPVRSKKCNHSFDKAAIIQHIKQRRNRARCPVAGCASFIVERDLEPNSGLAFRIKRLQRNQ